MFKLDLSNLDDDLKEEMGAVIKEIAIDLSNELKKEAPVDTGRLRQSMQVLQQSQDEIFVGSNVKYADNLQFGEPPESEVDLVALEKWVRRKMGVKEPGSWAIAQTLKPRLESEGPERNPFVDRAIENLEDKYR